MKAALTGVTAPLMPIAPVPRFRSPTPPDANCAPLEGAAEVTVPMELTNCPAVAIEPPPMPPTWADCSDVRSVCAVADASVRINDTASKEERFLLIELRLAGDASARDFISPPLNKMVIRGICRIAAECILAPLLPAALPFRLLSLTSIVIDSQFCSSKLIRSQGHDNWSLSVFSNGETGTAEDVVSSWIPPNQ